MQIVRADGGAGPCNPTEVIKDFGSVKIDGDKSFSASVSFDEEEPAPEEVSATGRLVEIADYPGAAHAILDEVSGVRYLLTSDSVDLQDYAVSGERVIVYGTPVPNQHATETILNVTRVEPAGTPPPADDGGSGNDGGSGGGNDGGSGGGPNSGGSNGAGSGSSGSPGGGSPGDNSTSSATGSGSGSVGPSSSGGVPGDVANSLRGVLPSTGGGAALWVLGAGVLLVAGGLLVRKAFR